jgi:pimeloyl-ACP methyl ester carboxylesterase
MLQLKAILLFRSVPNDDTKVRELLARFSLIGRFTPYVSGGRGAVRSEEAPATRRVASTTGADHRIQQERPAEVNRLLTEFLRSI